MTKSTHTPMHMTGEQGGVEGDSGGWEVSFYFSVTQRRSRGSCPHGDCSVTEALRRPVQGLAGKLKREGVYVYL